MRVFLMGFMGAGKTTFGNALAKELKVPFYDLDWFIERRYKKSISELFAESGEQSFRDIEKDMLHEVGEMDNVVIACGGSTPLFFDNMDYMLKKGQTLYLKVSNNILFKRLKEAKDTRPLIANKSDEELKEFILSEVERREKGYLRAEFIFSGDRLESETEIDETILGVKKLLNL
jgi:shikimate kinase